MSAAGIIGKRVRFRIGPLGALHKDSTRGPSELTFEQGHAGVVELELPPQPGQRDPAPWYAVTPDGRPDLYVPVTLSMIEPEEVAS